jgi:hypothetical protein
VSLPRQDRKMRTGVHPLVNGARLTNRRWSDEGASSGLGGLSPCQRFVCRGSGRVEDYGAGEAFSFLARTCGGGAASRLGGRGGGGVGERGREPRWSFSFSAIRQPRIGARRGRRCEREWRGRAMLLGGPSAERGVCVIGGDDGSAAWRQRTGAGGAVGLGAPWLLIGDE